MSIYLDVRKKLGDFSLNVQFESESRRIGILGASGCGKSMILKSIAGIETPDVGRIIVGDQLLFDSKQRLNLMPQKRKVGYLFQNYALFPTMTVEENIGVGIREKKEVKKIHAEKLIEKFGLFGLEKRLPGELSGGQQQRVALARIMAYKPEVILLDEPYAALDMFLRDRMEQELLAMLKDYEGTVILVSHNRDEIYRFSEELLVLDNGERAVFGNCKEIFARPEKRASARLTGCKNFSRIEKIDGHHLRALDFGAELSVEEAVSDDITYVGFHAHDFVPVWNEVGEECRRNRVRVQVESVAELPFERQYYLKGRGAEPFCWLVQKDKWKDMDEKGLPDYLELPPEKILLLKE